MTPENINSDIQIAINLARQGRVVESVQLLEHLLKKNRKNTNVLMLLAELNSKTGKLKHAEKNYLKVIQLTPGNKQAFIGLAMLFHGQGFFQKAEQLYKQSLKLDENLPVVNFNLGLVLQEQGKFEQAQEKYHKAISLDPAYAKAYANLAYIQLQLNKIDEAIGNYRKALERAPDVPEIYYNLGVALLKKGNIDEAEQCQRKALLLRENYSDAWEGLGAIYLYKDDSNMAVDSYRRALVCNPKSIAALCGLAKSFNMICLYEQANEKIKQALHIAPHNNEARLVQSQIFISLGRLDEALDNCNHILKRSPDDKTALSLMASIYEKKNQPEKAYTYLKPLLSDSNPGIETIVCFASVSKSINRVDEAIKIMEDVLQSSSYLQSDHRRHLYFALGKAHDSLHNYKVAFKNYESGNQLKQTCFNRSSFKHAIDASIKVFDKNFLTRHSLKSKSTRPVFIIGMPRSGTSLVEQIISSHPHVFGAGELNNVHNITKGAAKALGSEKTYPECLTEAREEDLSLFAKSYIDYLDGLDSDVLRVTDKMPSNYLHIGLIHTLFPKAHIIHCMRDPLDTCLSCYFQDFGGHHPWVYDLENIAHVYKEYKRMMSYWKNDLGISIYDVKYEELVENQEKISKELINYIGLDWDEQCIQFHENKRFNWTASYDQVRQPMYKKSVARWKNYKQQLTPVINILGINV